MSQKTYHLKDILSMELRYRANFINCLSGFKSLNLVGTVSREKAISNLAPFSSAVHIGSNPPLMGMISRPATVIRHTLENIIETGFWTMNQVALDFVTQSHQCAARYETSEFEATGLNEFYGEIPAPYVEESQVKIGLELVEKIDIASNGTILLIGKVVEVFLPEDILRDDGSLDLESANTVTVSGQDTYHLTNELVRLSYPKVNSALNKLH